MSLKRIGVRTEFKWNEILFNAVCKQFYMLGYKWYSDSQGNGPMGFDKFFSKNVFVDVDGFLLQGSDDLVDGCELLALDDFFNLTPEDVRVEPERFDCVFSFIASGGEIHKKLTRDEIDQVNAIFERAKS